MQVRLDGRQLASLVVDVRLLRKVLTSDARGISPGRKEVLTRHFAAGYASDDAIFKLKIINLSPGPTAVTSGCRVHEITLRPHTRWQQRGREWVIKDLRDSST